MTECPVTAGGLQERLRDFPNYDQVTRGYNILRDSPPLGLTQATDTGFTDSHIFSVVRKDHLEDSCSFKGYIADTAKICQDSRVFTKLEEGERTEEVEVTYEESEAVKFSNSFSFGAEVSLPGGGEACVDRVLAKSADIGETLENNGLARSMVSGVIERESTITPRFVRRTGASSSQENKESTTESSTSNGWTKGKSRSDINTRFCEEWLDGDEGSRTSEEDESLSRTKKTKTFSLPRNSVKNSASISEAEKSAGDSGVSIRKCRSYKLKIDANNPPTFTESFKVAVQSLHDLTLETRPYRLIVVKTGPREFNTTLNSTTEGRFDSAFSDFIRKESNKLYSLTYLIQGTLYLEMIFFNIASW